MESSGKVQGWSGAPQSCHFQEPLSAQDSSSLPSQSTLCWAPVGDWALEKMSWESHGQSGLQPQLSPVGQFLALFSV